eukprot:TRINITY_DN3107_c0_g1_i1.p1 TRINITY_DN3107_c0_g1~~TRINITY_DN3107_c0_g1_i1.p1  ORF type:complete len:753 (+),score=343.03 TRINITY_DN3107_c0_g1_i1:67-2259(+)
MAIPPPVAVQRPHMVTFGAVEGENRGGKPFEPRQREDPFFWLRDDERTQEDVLDHLRLENRYGEQELEHLGELRQTLYDEHVTHLKETDDKAPARHGKYFYYTRTVKGLSYPLHARKPVVGDERVPLPEAEEELLLDINKLGEGKPHCDVGVLKVSPDHTKIAFTVDFAGDEVYSIVVRDIATGATVDETVTGTDHLVVWGDDSTLFYLTLDEIKRPDKLYMRKLAGGAGAAQPAQAEDVLMLHEEDEQFRVGVGKSASGRLLLVEIASTETTEVRYIDLGAMGPLTVVEPRHFGLRYEVEHDGHDGLLILTNKDKAINNRLMRAPLGSPAAENWAEVIPYDDARKLDAAVVFKHHVVLEGRQGGLTQLWLMDKDAASGALQPATLRLMTFPEDLYEVGTSENRDFDTKHVRIHYSSLTTPTQWTDVDMANMDERVVIKEHAVLAFDRTLYKCKRVFATAPDKTQIPMSMVWRADLVSDIDAGKEARKPRATMLYGYGSYGICIDPGFHKLILPYLDRGMVYVIAHIRGGGEMGQPWYEEHGKYLTKRNTFQDFIACAEHLVEENYTQPSLLAAEGRSAGGLLMGNVINWRPDLFQCIIAGVPFVDLMNTMCDPSIPLTTNEWEEWGNPNEHKYFDYMLSYSPYDNVRAQPYPNVLITAGLHDPRVAFWEPAKWASKLRLMKTDKNHVVCKFDLSSGHFSASDRYKYIKEKAFDQAFVLGHLGLKDAKKQ